MSNSDTKSFSADGEREIVLVFPGRFHAPNPQIPLAMIQIAYPLVDEGYRVRILDMRIQDYRTFNFGDPVFVGISSMSGLQIHYGLELAEEVRTDPHFLALTDCFLSWNTKLGSGAV